LTESEKRGRKGGRLTAVLQRQVVQKTKAVDKDTKSPTDVIAKKQDIGCQAGVPEGSVRGGKNSRGRQHWDGRC